MWVKNADVDTLSRLGVTILKKCQFIQLIREKSLSSNKQNHFIQWVFQYLIFTIIMDLRYRALTIYEDTVHEAITLKLEKIPTLKMNIRAYDSILWIDNPDKAKSSKESKFSHLYYCLIS